MADDDSIFSRRDFVRKGVYASAGFALGGYAIQNLASMQKPTSSTVLPYEGALNVGGPAPRPLPVIDIEFAADGTIMGLEESLERLWYCGVNEFPGVRPGATDDNAFYFSESPEGVGAWYDELHGEPMRKADFESAEPKNSGWILGAGGTWRKAGGQGIPVIVVKLPDSEAPEEATDGFVATSGKCVHLCCVPAAGVSPQAPSYDAEKNIFCTCHKSVYDPRQIVQSNYLADRPPQE